MIIILMFSHSYSYFISILSFFYLLSFSSIVLFVIIIINHKCLGSLFSYSKHLPLLLLILHHSAVYLYPFSSISNLFTPLIRRVCMCVNFRIKYINISEHIHFHLYVTAHKIMVAYKRVKT